MIRLDHVSFRREGQTILDRITVQLDERRLAVIGANGCGKSTFLRLLNGLLLPSDGQVEIDGLDTVKEGKAIRRKVGFVFQNPDNQIVMPTVEEDLAFGMKNLKLDSDEIKCRINQMLAQYHLESQRRAPAHLLSGGQKQLLAICGILVMQPEIILFDEPTTQLDMRNKRIISKVIEALEQQVIIVSHDLDLLNSFDRVLVFDQGRIVCDDRPQQAISFYRNLMADG